MTTDPGIGGESDAALVARARRGDAAAFESLAQRHVRLVIGLIRQRVRSDFDAEDLAQETLLSAYRNLAQLKDDSRFAFWLYRIAIRKAGTSRRVTKINKVSIDALDSQEFAGAEPGRDDLQTSVRAAVAALEEPYRLVITLRYLEGLDATEIGRRLDLPPATVRARLSRAMPMLQQKLRSVCHARQ
jgi:RNA polymerase sigma-70 factor (ECF subfamily)